MCCLGARLERSPFPEGSAPAVGAKNSKGFCVLLVLSISRLVSGCEELFGVESVI